MGHSLRLFKIWLLSSCRARALREEACKKGRIRWKSESFCDLILDAPSRHVSHILVFGSEPLCTAYTQEGITKGMNTWRQDHGGLLEAACHRAVATEGQVALGFGGPKLTQSEKLSNTKNAKLQIQNHTQVPQLVNV